MKLTLTIIFILSLTSLTHAQSSQWSKWEWLMGKWQGEGGGKPGTGSGSFSLKPDLDAKVLVRKNHAEYPAGSNKQSVHDDLMIVYNDLSCNCDKATYFDNEGHNINYTVAYRNNTIILTSEPAPKLPLFRLTYTPEENNMVNIRFEIGKDSASFVTYVEGKSKKVSSSVKD